MSISIIQQLIAENRFDEAEEILKNAQSNDPNNIQWLIIYGEICLKKQDFANAMNHFNAALVIDPNSFQAKTYLQSIKNILAISNSFYFENTYLDDGLYE